MKQTVKILLCVCYLTAFVAAFAVLWLDIELINTLRLYGFIWSMLVVAGVVGVIRAGSVLPTGRPLYAFSILICAWFAIVYTLLFASKVFIVWTEFTFVRTVHLPTDIRTEILFSFFPSLFIGLTFLANGAVLWNWSGEDRH